MCIRDSVYADGGFGVLEIRQTHAGNDAVAQRHIGCLLYTSVYNVGGHNERPNIFIVKTIINQLHDRLQIGRAHV